MKVGEQIKDRYTSWARELAALVQIETVATELGIIDAEFWPDFGNGEYIGDTKLDGPYLKLTPQHIPGIALHAKDGTVGLSLVDTTPTLGDAGRALLPIVHRWEKSFDETRNMIQLTATYKGVRIVLQDEPPSTCTVERVEEEIEVPERVVPAHTEKKVRYLLKGDCDPLLGEREPRVVVAQDQHVDDIPF